MFRGICIILVVIYHAMFNLTSIFGVDVWMFDSSLMAFLQVFFVCCLAVISGISCSFSRSNAKRGIKTLLAGLIVTAVTYFAIPDQFIVFGILHFFGAAMLIYAALNRLLDKIPVALGVCLSALLFILTFNIYSVQIYTENPFLKILIGIIGVDTGIVSADYYPIFPWIFVFLAGCFLGRLFKEGRVPALFKANPVRFLSFIGRHTLLVYLIHQPIVFGGMYLWFEFIAK